MQHTVGAATPSPARVAPSLHTARLLVGSGGGLVCLLCSDLLLFDLVNHLPHSQSMHIRYGNQTSSGMRHSPKTLITWLGFTTHWFTFQVTPQPFPPIQMPPH